MTRRIAHMMTSTIGIVALFCALTLSLSTALYGVSLAAQQAPVEQHDYDHFLTDKGKRDVGAEKPSEEA
ncbi:MAG: hypothetical protein AAF752_15800 [Bacteroidota bacterium]